MTIDRTTFENCTVGLSLNDPKRSGKTYAFDSIIARNNQKGIECLLGASVVVTNALLQGNTGQRVIGVGGSITVVNSTVDGNSAGVSGWWSGSAAFTMTVDIENTIFSNNRRAIDLDDASTGQLTTTVTHSTFWGNVANVFSKTTTGLLTAPGANPPPGAGNVVANPRYLSSTDLHLGDGSPCIDSGDPAHALDHDLNQNPRPNGPAVDRGAYQSACPPAVEWRASAELRVAALGARVGAWRAEVVPELAERAREARAREVRGQGARAGPAAGTQPAVPLREWAAGAGPAAGTQPAVPLREWAAGAGLAAGTQPAVPLREWAAGAGPAAGTQPAVPLREWAAGAGLAARVAAPPGHPVGQRWTVAVAVAVRAGPLAGVTIRVSGRRTHGGVSATPNAEAGSGSRVPSTPTRLSRSATGPTPTSLKGAAFSRRYESCFTS